MIISNNERRFLNKYVALGVKDALLRLEQAREIVAFLKSQTEALRPKTIAAFWEGSDCPIHRCLDETPTVSAILGKLKELGIVERVRIGEEKITLNAGYRIKRDEYGCCLGLEATPEREGEVEVYGYILTDRNFSFDD
jgi:hypothetical protein